MTEYAIAILALVITLVLIKRFVSCLFRTVVTLALIALLVWLYFGFLA